jgi:hypothetical protein
MPDLTDAAIADLVLALYDYADGPKVDWDHIEIPASDDGIKWALKRVDGFDVVVLRGSTTFRDWFRDFEWVANPISRGQLGPIHPGFFDGCDEAWEVMGRLFGDKVILAGHSLGAARAAILTAFGVLEDRPPIRRVTFGEPRVGFAKFAEIVSHVPTASYHNRHDVIPDLPFSIGFEEYRNSCSLTEVNVRAHGDALLWGPFAPHHMKLYREALP